MERLIKILTPRSRGQWLALFAGWTALFNLVFLSIVWIVGLRDTAPLWLWLIVGGFTCAPFLYAALAMLRMHLRLQRRLFTASRTDLLTNMPNRRAFIDVVSKRLPQESGALLMIDVDHFKAVNDTFGHAFGDEVLRRMADTIKPVIPASFFYARLGGEEFAVMLFDTTPEKIRHLSQIMTGGVRVRPPGSKATIHVTCSVGAALAEAGDDLSGVMSKADTALYKAKEQGRARLVMADDGDETPPLLLAG